MMLHSDGVGDSSFGKYGKLEPWNSSYFRKIGGGPADFPFDFLMGNLGFQVEWSCVSQLCVF